MNWLTSLLSKHRVFLLVLLSILAVYGISLQQRLADYHDWMENPQDYVVGPVTAMTEMDAYWWLKVAADMDAGRLGQELADPVKEYPDLNNYPEEPNLLAELISLCKAFTDGDYYRSGLLLIPWLAGLFVFPLYLYFNRLGYGASAVLGGLIGSFSIAYYQRTLMGRVDTDLLNTFFPLAIACCMLPISKEKSGRHNLLLALAAGGIMYLFNWWYQQPVFILIHLFFLAGYLFVQRMSWKLSFCLLLVFLVASGPHYVVHSIDSLQNAVDAYLLPLPTAGIAWPDTMVLNAESMQISLIAKLNMLHGYWPVLLAGFCGLAYLYLNHFRKMVPISALLLLGVWSLFGAKRFTMYLPLFIGVGAGVLIELLVNYLGRKFRLGASATTCVSLLLMFSLFFATLGGTGFGYREAPIVPLTTTQAFLDIKDLVPKHSAMFTWWDYGYPLMQIGDFATYHDGSVHGGIRSTLIARALTTTSQQEMLSLLSYLEDHGFEALNFQIEKGLPVEELIPLAFNYPGEFRGESVYVLYLERMLDIIGPISIFGTWDFSVGKGDMLGYRNLNCFSQSGNIIGCREGKIDMDQGLFSNSSTELPLKAALVVNDGYVIDRFDYPQSQGTYLQILMKNKKIFKVQLLGERLFRSNFNQQFLLGNYDREHFVEVYNNFPVARLLKVKGKAASAAEH